MPEDVNRGELDGLFAKPINTLFLVSLREHQWYELSTCISGLVILVYSVGSNIGLISQAIIVSVFGLVALFSIMVMISSLSFHINRLTAIGSVWDALSKSARFPLDIFSAKLVFFIAPFLLIVTLPSEIILGKVNSWYWLVQIGGSVTLFLIAYKFWQFSIKRYSSASS